LSLKPSLLIFDLDGTLIDSERDLILSVNAALLHLGREPLHDDLVRSYVGDGAPVLIRRAVGAGASDAEHGRALQFFLDYYRLHMLDNTTLYEGVTPTLERFRQAGIPMAVLTNKPVRFSQAIVDGLGVGRYFYQVYGGNSFEQKKPHRIGVDRLIEEGGGQRATTWMIGDSATDILTARNAAVLALGVTFGFKPESLRDTPPDILVDTFPAIADRLL
jgi:phosphoglycolate phosphatase